jgi:hypothetical protein
MKTITHFFSSEYKTKFNHLCTELLSPFWLSSQERLLLREIEKNKEEKTLKSSSEKKPNRIQRMIRALAVQVGAVSNSKVITKAFPRFVTGLVLLVWVAPYADTFYTRLDFNARVSPDIWYYESYHWLFMCLGPYLKSLITVVGLYMCLVHKASPIKTGLAAYCLMFDVGKIIWLLFVKNHDEYRTIPPVLFAAYGLITSGFLLYMIDLLSYWFNHKAEAIRRRLLGLRIIADKAEPSMIVAGFCQTIDDSLNVDQFQTEK